MAFQKVEQAKGGKAISLMEKPGSVYTGYILDRKEVTINSRKAKIYTMLKDDGDALEFWGSTMLDNLLQDIPNLTLVRITYVGKEKIGGGKSLNKVTVEVDKEKTISKESQ